MAGQTKLMLPSGGSVSISASDSTQNTTVTLPGGDVTLATTSQVMGRNRIINGDMRIDQRNAGASVTNIAGGVYTVDRFNLYGSQASKCTIQQNAGSVTPPTGFTNYAGITSLSSYSVLAGDEFVFRQPIEGVNCFDLAFGTASAATVTLSFWVRSSLTGNFGGNLANSGLSRAYPFSYTISAANTWEKKTVTITGDTTGTWLTNTGIGLYVSFGLGVGSTYGSGTAGAWTGTYADVPTGSTSVVGTNGATFYITGVQLEKATTATPFEFRPYGQELALCQRYYQLIGNGWGKGVATTSIQFNATFYVPMRTSPSIGATTLRCTDATTADFTNTSPTVSTNNVDTLGGRYTTNNWSGLTSGTMYFLLPIGTSAAPVQFSAEL